MTALNLITDVPGLRIGQAEDILARTGVTVLLGDAPMVCAVDARGGGPASRELDVLKAENLVQEIDALVLSGGSVYGLAAADGVAAWLGAHGRGYGDPSRGAPLSPIVPAACLYDLANGGAKAWGQQPPYRDLGLAAVNAAASTIDGRFELGGTGAGFGALAGALLGGVGSASAMVDDAVIGALAVVNSFGSVVVPGDRAFWAAPFEVGDEFGGVAASTTNVAFNDWGLWKGAAAPRQNTTLVCVATDLALSRVELQRVAIMAQDGLARAIRPAHAPFDGDIVFALSTARRPAPKDAPRPLLVARLGAAAADVVARAIARGVFASHASPERPGRDWRSL